MGLTQGAFNIGMSSSRGVWDDKCLAYPSPGGESFLYVALHIARHYPPPPLRSTAHQPTYIIK
jgi:hypothetical protein